MDTSLAIVIPVFNDPKGIGQTVTSVEPHLENTQDVSLIVVDNCSTDRTPEIIDSLMEKSPSFKHVNEANIQSSYAARNTGIRQTDANVIAFLDADMTVSEDWLNAALDKFEYVDADYMGTEVSLVSPESPPLAARYDYHTSFPVEHYLTEQHFAPTCCLFVRREVFQNVGLFDPRLTSGGDKEFGNRVHDAGFNMHFAEDVTVFHPTRNTLSELISKDIRVGRGLCQLQRYHPERYGKPGIPPRPSGAKRPSNTVSFGERIVFGALGTMLTGMRGLGYYSELVSPTPAPDIDGIPTLD